MLRRDPSPASRPRQGGRAHPGPWLLLFGVAFALRALYALWALGPDPHAPGAAAEVDAVAWNLARGYGFSLGGVSRPSPTALVPPLVPWAEALIYRSAGHHYILAALLLCFASALVPPLVASLGAATFGGPIGRAAGWLCACHPLLVSASVGAPLESALSAALLVALVLSAAWVKTPRPGRALGVGLMWGVASLTLESALLLPALIAAWAWVPIGLTVAPADRLRQVTLVLVGILLVAGPWCLRNTVDFRAPVLVTTRAGRSLLDGNRPLLHLESDSGPAIAGAAAGKTSEAEADARALREAWKMLALNLRSWPAMAADKLAHLWSIKSEEPGRVVGPLAARLGRLDLLFVWSLLVLPLAALGLGHTLAGPRRWYQSLGALVVTYFSILGVIFQDSLRTRVPAEPLITLMAAAGFEDLRRRVRALGRGLRVIEGSRR